MSEQHSGVIPVDLRDYVDFSDEQPRQIRVMASEHLAVDLWCLQPRQATPVLVDAERDTQLTVIGGRGWFVTDEGEIGLDALGSMLVSAGVVHGIDNRSPDPLIVLAICAPPSDRPADEPVAHTAAAVLTQPERSGRLRRAFGTLLGAGDGDASTSPSPSHHARPDADAADAPEAATNGGRTTGT